MDRRNTLKEGEAVGPGKNLFVTPNTKARLDAEFLCETIPQPKCNFSSHPPNIPFIFQATAASSDQTSAPVRRVLNTRDLHKYKGNDLERRQAARKKAPEDNRGVDRFLRYSAKRTGLIDKPLSSHPQAQKRAVAKMMSSKLTRKEELVAYRKKKEEEKKAADKAKAQTRNAATGRLVQMQKDITARPPAVSGFGKSSASQGTAPKFANLRSTTTTTTKVQRKENVDPGQVKGNVQGTKAATQQIASTLDKANIGSKTASVADGRRVTRAMSAANVDIPFATRSGKTLDASGRGGPGKFSSGRGAASSVRGSTSAGRGAPFTSTARPATSSAPRAIRGRGGKTPISTGHPPTDTSESQSLPPITEQQDVTSPNDYVEPSSEVEELALLSIEAEVQATPALPVSQEIPAPAPEAKFKGIDECYLQYSSKFNNTCTQLYLEKRYWDEQLNTTIPEEKTGDITSMIGKLTLLLNSKLPQFVGLLSRYLQKNSTAEPVLEDDLGGWWDTVSIQVKKTFEESKTLRDCQARQWVDEAPQVVVEEAPRIQHVIKAKKTKSAVNAKLKEFLAQQRLRAKSEGVLNSGEIKVDFQLEKALIGDTQATPISEASAQRTSETGPQIPILQVPVVLAAAAPESSTAADEQLNAEEQCHNATQMLRTPARSMPPPARTPRSVKRTIEQMPRDVRRTSLLQMRLSSRGRISETGNHQLTINSDGFNFNANISLMQLGLDDSVHDHTQATD